LRVISTLCEQNAETLTSKQAVRIGHQHTSQS